MPPKPKLYKTKGAGKSSNSSNPSTSNSPNLLNDDMAQQFEVELYWCVKQLQIAVESGKLNNKQVQDHTKALNTLMNNSAPLVKKRQVMRLSFGDYRAKMAAEEQKHSKNLTQIKVKSAKPSKKSVFLKKSNFTLSGENNFKFNFSAADADLNTNLSDIHISDFSKDSASAAASSKNKCNFVQTDNSFKFNF